MSGYKKCPRCELNWIKVEEDLCDVCKAELKLGGISLIEDDEVEEVEERICPVCKINLLDEGEEMCATCREEKLAKLNDEADKEEEDEENDDSWREFVEEDGLEAVDDSEEILLGDLEEDESEKDEILEDEEGFDDLDISYDYDEEISAEDDDDEEEEEDEE